MKVLISTMQFGPGYFQGTERYISNLAAGLRQLDCEVVVAGGDPQSLHSNSSKASLFTLPTNGWATLRGASIKYYERLFNQIQPDIFHLVNPGHIGLNSLFAANNLGIPVFVTVTDFWWICPKHTLVRPDNTLCSGFVSTKACIECITTTHRNDGLRKLAGATVGKPVAEFLVKSKARHTSDWAERNEVVKKALLAANTVICISRSAFDRIQQLDTSIRCRYEPVGLAAQWLDRPKARTQLGSETELRIGFAGSIDHHKGLQILLDAMHRLKDTPISLSVAGDFCDENYKRKILDIAEGLNTTWLGRLSEPEMLAFYENIDLLVVPSLSPENQPQVILEAFARGCRVVCSDAPGATELVPKGWSYPAFSPAALAEVLLKFGTGSTQYQLPPINSAQEMAENTMALYTAAYPTKR